MNNELKISGIILGGIALGLFLIPVFASQDVYFLNSGSGTGNVTLALDDLTDVMIISLTNGQIIVYNSTSGQWENENQATFSDTTTCGNLGAGILICAGDNVQLKSLIAGTGISITNSSTTITIANTLPESTVCTNLGTHGEGVYLSGNCDFKKLLSTNAGIFMTSNSTNITFTNFYQCLNADGVGSFDLRKTNSVGISCTLKALTSGTGISLTSNTNDIQIDNTSPESTVCANLGDVSSLSEGIYVSGNCNFKKLLEGSNIALSSNGTHITIAVTGINSDDTTCTNVGTGSNIYKDGECNFRSVLGSSDISVTQQTNTITVDYNGTAEANTASCPGTAGPNSACVFNAKTGVNLEFRRLWGGTFSSGVEPTTITLTNGTHIAITEQAKGQLVAQAYGTATKTNIGNAFVDIYATLWDEEEMQAFDFTNFNECRAEWLWDYVGTGSQSVQWVAATGTADVLIAPVAFSADQNPHVNTNGDSGWVAKPAAFTGYRTIEWQGKSTVAGDDPVAHGYQIYCR